MTPPPFLGQASPRRSLPWVCFRARPERPGAAGAPRAPATAVCDPPSAAGACARPSNSPSR